MLETKLSETEVLAQLLEVRLAQTRLEFEQKKLENELHVIRRRCEHWKIQAHEYMYPSDGSKFTKECLTCGQVWPTEWAELTVFERLHAKVHEYETDEFKRLFY